MCKMHGSKLLAVVGTAVLVAGGAMPALATPFFNEVHYDNEGTDVGEFIEIAGLAGTDLTGWSIELVNGNGGGLIGSPIGLSGTLADEVNGFGFLTLDFPTNGIQNGAPDGMALVDNLGRVVQFLSYEGSFTATSGAATGLTSTDIGVAESGSTPVGFSVQVTGNIAAADLVRDDSGKLLTSFTWAAPAVQTPGAANTNQTFDGSGGNPPPPPPPPPTPVVDIPTIQGAGHTSTFAGQTIETSGIVTAVASNGFYVQDPTGDGNDATSDGIFVFTGGAPGVAVGDEVTIAGTVGEFIPGGAATGNLSTTQITGPTINIVSAGNALPAATVIGAGGRQPPTQSIDSDNFALFNPGTDGIDFFESLEGMRVTLQDAQAVAATNQFGEIFAVADQGAGATGMNSRGGITISEGDFNPERLQIDDTLLAGNSPLTQTGDKLGDVTGVIAFNFGNFELLATEAPTVTPGGLEPETASIEVGGNRLSVATYNVLNLDANDPDEKFAGLARQIVDGLLSPDIIALQEIQDNSGPTNDGVTSADITLQKLIDAIVAAGGPRFEFAEIAPVDGTSGGEPGGNIRPAFLFNPARVSLVDGSLMIVPGAEGDPAFDNARKPLVATFLFNGHEVTVVNNHLTSKGGSSPLFGTIQPDINGGVEQRTAQASFVNAFIRGLLDADPTANVIALGDLNEFQFLAPLLALAGQGAGQILFELAALLLPPEELFSFIFEGNAQLLDHILVTAGLLSGALIDIVHLNTGLLDFFADHDPVLASLLLPRAIPTASTLLLFLLGIGVLLAMSRRRPLAGAV